MSKKMVVYGMLAMTVIFLLLGGICFLSATQYEGTKVSIGYYSGGSVKIIDSGSVGKNSAEKERRNAWGTGCLVMSGICGVTGIFIKIVDKH